jgi:hypothetical protein
MIVLVIALVLVAPVAHASPPDPLWIAGVYDAADIDDAVLAVTAMEGSVARDVPTVIPVLMIAAVPHPTCPDRLNVARGGREARNPPTKF